MVAKITTGKSIRGMLLYNENKVSAGQAILIMASGFAADIDRLNFNQKLERFRHLTELKPNVKTNAMHISLNFHHSEHLGDQTLQQVASCYMEQIGFADQPFLVYRHQDAAHCHLHITTTNITPAAERMDLHDIGKRLSEPARKAIELEFGLVKADDQLKDQSQRIRAVDLKKVKYGELPTKEAIRNVVTAVTREYKFTSLTGYNAVLNCFNVTATRGAEHTAMYQRGGLMFSVVDQHGKQVGVPIKASALYGKPTLKNLEKKFVQNLERRKPYKQDLKLRVGNVLQSQVIRSEQQLKKAMLREDIELSFHKNAQNLVFGLTYIDHKNKVVFTGSDLGKFYTAKSVLEGLSKASQANNTGRQTNYRGQHVLLDHPRDSAHPINKILDKILAEEVRQEQGIKIPKRKKRRRKNQIISQEISIK